LALDLGITLAAFVFVLEIAPAHAHLTRKIALAEPEIENGRYTEYDEQCFGQYPHERQPTLGRIDRLGVERRSQVVRERRPERYEDRSEQAELEQQLERFDEIARRENALLDPCRRIQSREVRFQRRCAPNRSRVSDGTHNRDDNAGADDRQQI